MVDKRTYQRAQRLEDLATNQKHLVFFVCDLVAVFGPCSLKHIGFFLTRLLPKVSFEPSLALGLGRALGLVDSFPYEDTELYFRPLQGGRLTAFQKKRRYVDIPTLRAEMIAAMQACDPCRKALATMGSLYAP